MANLTVSASNHPLHKEITIINAKGFIDTTTAPEFERTFQAALSQNKYNLIIDLKNITYISSAGWGIFIGELKRIRAQKGNLFFAGMSPEVTETFELLELNSILKAFPTVEMALQKGFAKSVETVRVEKRKSPRTAPPEKAAAGLESPHRLPVPESSPVAVLSEETRILPTRPNKSPFGDFFKFFKWF
jgi:anti-sigma B factor antagonist